ncbi:FAD-dependent oxidoreductase [Caulobacter sp.]|uniref:NAD(P)/FAD-dependent oxidoreductase n=1 Tax=Caulobacter sp. TaxID=78 RepID=UPI002B48D306|nr:FAD-dependent oxidoreductase [Caulobacter sp.]HJV42360.1 FAD-dependent oxidoreductase [Caulobacter sp.]
MEQGAEVRTFDVVILGGGIAGAALAARLSDGVRVAVVEREAALGLHTTGRSAAMYIPSYGSTTIQGLTVASRSFFVSPPSGFGPPLLSPRPVMHIADEARRDRLEILAAKNDRFVRLEGEAARAAAPSILRPQAVDAALIERNCGDLDVGRLHQGFLRQAKEAGAVIRTGAGRCVIERRGADWRLRGADLDLVAPVLVNAAGAWADELAADAGVEVQGLTPMRRTVILVQAPNMPDFASWPVVKDIDERFYFRPYGGRLLITPADETPSPPCDAAPEEMDIAEGMARFEAVADHPVRGLAARWAGLRTFASDRAPIIGWSRDTPGFFWLAGLGGFGIQTAPAMGRLAAALVAGGAVPSDLVDRGVDVKAYAPSRAS